jgi:hypothetical protein
MKSKTLKFPYFSPLFIDLLWYIVEKKRWSKECPARRVVMGLWQGVALVSLKYHWSLPCSTSLCPVGGHPWNDLTGLSGVAAHRVVSLRPSFTPLDTPRRTPMVVTVFRHMYAYGKTSMALPCRWPPFTRLISLVGMARCRASIWGKSGTLKLSDNKLITVIIICIVHWLHFTEFRGKSISRRKGSQDQ